ncbi:aminopeptidase P family protein [Methanobacterium alkalithermotolerans]|uniref:Aminopeptidase P family protein n=1 Tax=Methanobacterium alkalithermotolerans TaxID=2731220 RepID=A0A8T8KC97_9EURY|nr:aminopeptidase P family protein [Methanobacterium alkalithermotolerans]QUH22991.1 aminopeptidase P family protein [Methanobacterium alkalithermotolerans]
MDRVNNILDEMLKEEIPAMLLLQEENIFYMSGFKPSGFSILVLKDEPLLLVSKMDSEEANETSRIPLQEFNSFKDLKNMLNELKLSKLGIEESMKIGFYNKIKNNYNMEVTDLIERSRMIKTSHEINSIKKSISIAEKSFNKLEFKKNEWELAAELEYLMRMNGSQKEAFETIVASGSRSSLPHALPTSNKLEYPLLIDWGAVWDNYSSDCTRTIIETEKQEEVLNICLEAQKEAIKSIKPGISACEIDNIARSVIKDYGYGDNFIHSTGHGVGLQVHEKPSISSREEITLEKNMVITIEPGIYLEGEWGVRIEDIVLIKNKAGKLSKLPPVIND